MTFARCPAPRAVLLASLGCLAAAPAALPAQRGPAAGAEAPVAPTLDQRLAAVAPKVVAWRRDLHQHPELSNQETRTSALVAAHLRALGLETRTGVGGHGVIGVLRGGRPGKTVTLRADMDALPVTEQVDLPFASKMQTDYNGQRVGVMHACGHDLHVSMLMGAAEVLAGMKAELPGTVVFLFQPNEEGDPGKPSGAKAMLAAGAMDGALKPDAVFGLHVGITPAEAGHLTYRPNGFMAAADFFRVVVRGRQTHGSTPWAGVDPVAAAAYAVTAMQTLVSRQLNLTVGPAVVTVGAFNAGVRGNILPDSAVLLGTLRTFDPAMRRDLHARLRRTVDLAVQAQGATAGIDIQESTPVTANDPALTARMAETLRRVAGPAGAGEGPPVTVSEDFGYFAERTPGLFIFLGVRPKGSPDSAFVSNHSPKFFADEAALPVGTRALVELAADFLAGAR